MKLTEEYLVKLIKEEIEEQRGDSLRDLMENIMSVMMTAKREVKAQYGYGPDQVVRTAEVAIESFKKAHGLKE